MNLNSDVLIEYRSNRKAYNEKLEYFTLKLDEVENLLDDIMFDARNDEIQVSENELDSIANEEVKGIDIKAKDLKDLLVDTKKILKNIKRLEGRNGSYNKSRF